MNKYCGDVNMSKIMNLIKSAIVDGFFVLLPVLLIYLILEETYTLIYEIVEPLAHQIPGKDILGIGVSSWLVILTILLLLLLVGLVMRTGIGKLLGSWIDENILSHIPGYELLKSVSKQFSGKSEEILLSPAIFSSDMGTYMFAFILDEYEDGFYSLFVPMAPTPMMGTVQYVKSSRVKRLDIPPGQVIDSLMKWGIGSKAMFNLQDYITK